MLRNCRASFSAAMMVMMAAAPASAKILNGDRPADPDEPGPPAFTGNGPNKATVTHCNSPSIPGGEGTFVFNKNK